MKHWNSFKRALNQDPRTRFDVGTGVTFAVFSIWWVGLLIHCPGVHAWRWIANQMTYGLIGDN